MAFGFARTRRWVALHVTVAIVASACVGLGLWQLRRLEQRRVLNERITSRAALPPLTVEEIARAPVPGELEYRRAIARGTYDVAREVVLLSRSHRSLSGHHLLTPLVLDDGTAILVDRGWYPITFGQRPPIASAVPPSGPVRVEGVVFATRRPGRFGPRETRAGPLASTVRADIDRLRPQFPYRILPSWILLRAQRPPTRGEFPIPQGAPSLGNGPHLGYAIQWFAFASVAIVGYAFVLRARSRRSGTSPRSTTNLDIPA